MSTISNNVVSNGLVGSTVSVGYGAVPPKHSLPSFIGAQGSAGQFLTNGLNGTTWANASSNYNIGDGVMKISGDPATLEVKGKMLLNGLDLEERLKTIEKVLAIPERDAAMENKYPSLKKKYDEYINALEKYKTFERIKTGQSI